MTALPPDIGLKALDVFIKLLPFLKSWTGQRRREYVGTLLTPLYESFGEIHEFYLQLMLTTRDAVVAIHVDEYDLIGNQKDALATRRALADVIDGFSRRRMEDEHLRDTLRQDAQVFLDRITWPEERRFLVLVCFYFLQRGGISTEDQDLDREAREVIEKSGITHWDTPSMRLYKELRNAESPETALAVLDAARHDLNQRYMNARLAFRKVQSALVMKA